uniref:Large ribosomal subunit protein mL53 n=1 Tax=Pelodiscus sinensis TaxID=13735 RepID=K7G5P7_PELSI
MQINYRNMFSIFLFNLYLNLFRIFLEQVNSKKSRASNINCVVKTDVRHDGTEPVVDIMFADGDRLIMKGANLTAREMLLAFNSRCIAKGLKAEEKNK